MLFEQENTSKFNEKNELNEDDSDEGDTDEGNSEEIDKLFDDCELIKEVVLNKDEYVLHVHSTNETNPNIACCLSNNQCVFYKLSPSDCTSPTALKGHKEKLVGCKFSSYNPNLLYTASSDGVINVWDVRTTNEPAATFTDTTVENGKYKTFTCFDVSSNDRLLSAGTDIYEGDPYLLFWDVGNCKLLGGYWESHTDDITQVKFHSEDMNKLISGSTDGLINVYDLSQSCEDDALLDSLNTQSSVEQLLWFEENKTKISCITHTADLQLWDLDGAEPYKHIYRAELARAIKRKNEGYVYIASHQGEHSLLVLVGSNYRDGECIRGLEIKKGQLLPAIGFKKNAQRIRCSWCIQNVNMVLTGGEKGLLNIWRTNKKL